MQEICHFWSGCCVTWRKFSTKTQERTSFQYYATVDVDSKEHSDTIQWLNKEHIEDRSGLDDEVPALTEMMGTGQSVGSLVTSMDSEVSESPAHFVAIQHAAQRSRVAWQTTCE